jgi:hypothetical protein
MTNLFTHHHEVFVKKSSSAPLNLATMDDVPWPALEQLVQSFSTNVLIPVTPGAIADTFAKPFLRTSIVGFTIIGADACRLSYQLTDQGVADWPSRYIL